MPKDFWYEWFGTKGREIGSPEREYVGTVPEFLAFIGKCEIENLPCYVSVQPYSSRGQVYGLEKLFYDFDSKDDPPDLEKAWAEASDFAEKLRFFYRVEPLLIFSGRKGYHVDVWLQEVVSFEPEQELVAKDVYRTLQEKLLEGLKYSTLDLQPIGDIKRLARLPYTTHEGSGLLCQPVDLDRRPIELTSIETYRAHGLSDEIISRVVKEVVDRMGRKDRKPSGTTSYGDIREPVKALIGYAKEGKKLSHGQRLIILFELINNGYSDESIQEVFSTQPDYNQRRTQYFIDQAKRRGYRPFRIEKIMREAGV
jgi:hypothetical protein